MQFSYKKCTKIIVKKLYVYNILRATIMSENFASQAVPKILLIFAKQRK